MMIGEHKVFIPQPKKKSDIFFIDQPKENQYWQRDKIIKQYKQIWFDFLPGYTKMWQASTSWKNGLLETLNEEDSNYIDLIYQQETDRRINGIHFMNNGELTWITGDHYFFLMYARMQRHDGKGNYADYREFQRDYAYLIHHCCMEDPDYGFCRLGLFLTKAKKTGITNFHWSGFYLNRATLYKNKNLGYMNIDLIQAAKTFNDYFMYSYNGLISPLRAEYRNRSLNDGSIVFAKSFVASKKNVFKQNTDDDDLNTSVFCVATKAKAFDVAVMAHITFDEPTKYKTGFGEIWRTNKEAVKIQSKFNGRAWLFNYTPEDNGDSFKEARTIFFDSELKTVNKETGQTKSGLICHHIPACESWEGAFDKYGKCDKQKALKEIQRERDSAEGNKSALQAIIRQYANTKQEAWGYGGTSKIYDPVRLAEMEINLEDLQRSGIRTFEGGELQWINPLWEVGKKDKRPKGVFDRVRWVPLTRDQVKKGVEGKMRMYEKELNENCALLYGKDEWGNLKPPPKFKNVSGIDPADFRDAGNAEEGSMIGMHTMPVYNPTLDTGNGRPATKIIGSEYYARPDNPEEWYQDIVKWIIFHGCLIIIEANNGTIATRLEDEGLGHYMMFKNEDGVLSLYIPNHKNIPGKELRHIRNSKSGAVDTVADIIYYTQNYLIPGNPDHNEIDYGNLIKSERLIKQWKDFDPANTKPYDLAMGFGYTLMCHENYVALLNKPQNNSGYEQSEIQTVWNRLLKSH